MKPNNTGMAMIQIAKRIGAGIDFQPVIGRSWTRSMGKRAPQLVQYSARSEYLGHPQFVHRDFTGLLWPPSLSCGRLSGECTCRASV